ncbi:MAG TPA: hypothetical protein VIJ14_01070, partial [Rhabdochlamydiaceae bacterium]
NGNVFMGEALVLDTPCGKIVKSLIDAGCRLGVSTRGAGTLKDANSQGISEVCDDYHLCCIDVVADPSFSEAFVNGVMESKEWMLKEGVLTEVKMDKIQKQVKGLTKVQLSEDALLRIFESFLNDL